MMKKFIFITICASIFLTGTAVFTQAQNSLTVTSYFPEPVAAYDRIQLIPDSSFDLAQSDCAHGTLSYPLNPNNLIYFCYDKNDDFTTDDSEWKILQGVWSSELTENLFDIFLSNELNYNDIKVGIGTSFPEFKLTLNLDGGILAYGDPDTADSLLSPAEDAEKKFLGLTHSEGTRLLWYPRKSAFRAGHLDAGLFADYWDEGNIDLYSVALGHNQSSRAESSMVLSGEGNIINANSNYAVIAGGLNNAISSAASHSAIGGGESNTTYGSYSLTGGGSGNSNETDYSVIIGGTGNTASKSSFETHQTIGGGSGNTVSSFYATVIGGQGNTAGGDYAAVGGGKDNIANGSYSVIIGGDSNKIDENNDNDNAANYNTIAGGAGNRIDRVEAFLEPGAYGGESSVIGGGSGNINEQINSTIGGGENNKLSFKKKTPETGADKAGSASVRSTILGGRNNRTAAGDVFIGGGENNQARDNPSVKSNGTIGGGQNNIVYKSGLIGGGLNNVIGESHSSDLGTYSKIAGGESVQIKGDYSWAGGENIILQGDRSFAWGHSDEEDPLICASGANDRFIIATGRMGVRTVSPKYKLDINGDFSASGSLVLYAVPHQSPTGEPSLLINNTELLRSFDIAEVFEYSEIVEPGDVVMMDETNNGKLKKADSSYNKKVIGIISTSPAITFEGSRVIIGPTPKEDLENNREQKQRVALKGRVPVKVTLENGPINIGDPLTSSSIPGHAMKSTDPQAFGTTIGKALKPFNGGPNGETKGVIVVFVALY